MPEDLWQFVWHKHSFDLRHLCDYVSSPVLTWTNVSHTHATVFAVGKTALGAHALALCNGAPSLTVSKTIHGYLPAAMLSSRHESEHLLCASSLVHKNG